MKSSEHLVEQLFRVRKQRIMGNVQCSVVSLVNVAAGGAVDQQQLHSVDLIISRAQLCVCLFIVYSC